MNHRDPKKVDILRSDDGVTVRDYSPMGELKRTYEVAPADVPLYDLLGELAGGDVPESMLAGLATDCADLVEVRETVANVQRGSIDISTGGYGMGYCHNVREAIEEHQDREPIRLAAVGCSGTKSDNPGAVPAKYRYAGGYWTNKREYGEAVADYWAVISAEHAILRPDDPVEPYERTVGDLEGVPIHADGRTPTGEDIRTMLDQWATDVYEQLATWMDDVAGGIDPRDVELEILLGKKYEEPLRDRAVFDRLRCRGDLSVSFPFREVDGLTGIGRQRQWLSEQAERAGGSA